MVEALFTNYIMQYSISLAIFRRIKVIGSRLFLIEDFFKSRLFDRGIIDILEEIIIGLWGTVLSCVLCAV